MNRNLIVTVVVVVLIILAGGAYMTMNKQNFSTNNQQTSPVQPSETVMEASVAPSPAMEKTSLKNFMSMAGTQKCDFSDPDTSNSGTVYLDSGKMRGDFSSNAGGKTSMTHMINDGKNAYIWMDDQATGFKTSIDAIEKMSGQTGVQQTVDINKQVDYKCSSWSLEADKFTVPADKKFSDMNKMVEDAMKKIPSAAPSSSAMTADDKASACAACEGLEGDVKTQCKKALKCN